MSDRFDADLKRALKESTAKSLEGWEFSPAMRQTVLKRLAEEEEAQPPAPPVPLRRPRPIVTHPAVWVAAAAAAFVLAFNMMEIDLGSGGNAAKKESAAPMTASSEMHEPGANTLESDAPENSAANSGGMGGKPAGAKSVDPGQFQGEVAVKAAETSDPKNEGRADMAITSQAGAVGPAAPARIHLQMPEALAGALMFRGTEDGAGIAALAHPVERLAMVRVGMTTAVRTQRTVQFLDAQGAVVREQELPEGAGQMLAWNGQVVTSGGRELVFFNSAGEPQRKLTLPATPDGFAVSPDGRVAALFHGGLQVFEGDKVQFEVPGAVSLGFTFGPDGSLAAVVRESDGTYLKLFGRNGSSLWRTKLNVGGMGIAFAAGGEVIIAGGEAFHRSGQPIWQAPLPTQDLFTMGPDGPVVVRDAQRTISLLRPSDGTEIWTVEHPGRQTIDTAISEDAELLAIVASVDDTAAVWVLDRAGGLRYSERLTAQPSGLAVEGEALFLLMPHAVETRALPPR